MIELHHAIGGIGLAYVISANLVIWWLQHRGTYLMRVLEANFPQLYQDLGRPRPGLFYTERRRSFMELMLRPGYDVIPEPLLVVACRRYRRWMLAGMVYMIAGMLAVGGLVLWYQRTFHGA